MKSLIKTTFVLFALILPGLCLAWDGDDSFEYHEHYEFRYREVTPYVEPVPIDPRYEVDPCCVQYQNQPQYQLVPPFIYQQPRTWTVPQYWYPQQGYPIYEHHHREHWREFYRR